MPYIGGELRSLVCAFGGCSIEVTFGKIVLAGGELGGVTVWEKGVGVGPGGQYGICLFGTGVVDRGMLMFKADREDEGTLC